MFSQSNPLLLIQTHLPLRGDT
uniref:Uncharacterized protein n=1 Tax=Anguilla anguilla TaxID=7936 RepID=A0A0E9QYL6_ANGAN